jgi:flavin-dependent dehydrogenase
MIRLTTAGICVIGGGPAGSTIASRLALLGYDTCLVDRGDGSERHFAASLPSTVLPLLEFIGVRDQVDSCCFLRPYSIKVLWSESSAVTRRLAEPLGFHVDRQRFDSLLLQNAQAKGVRVLQPWTAMRPVRSGSGLWSIRLQAKDRFAEVVSRFVIDASGCRTLFGGRRKRVSKPLMALYARWQSASDIDLEGRIEAGDQQWFWYAPMDARSAIAAIFTDPKRVTQLARQRLMSTYHELMRGFRLFPRETKLQVDGEVRICDASSRYAEELIAPDWVRIGDSAFTLDPISSQGIQSALATALQSAIVVNTLLKSPNDANAAMTFYRDRIKEKVTHHAVKTARFYEEAATRHPHRFWRDRAHVIQHLKPIQVESAPLDANCRLQLSDRVTIARAAVIKETSVVTANAIVHRDWNHPIAFLDGVELTPLLMQIQSGQTAASIVERWSHGLPAEVAWNVIRWLWSRMILVPAI